MSYSLSLHLLDSNTRLVIQHDPRKLKTKTTCPLKKHFFPIFSPVSRDPKFPTRMFEQKIVWHLRLHTQQKCTVTSPELIGIVV